MVQDVRFDLLGTLRIRAAGRTHVPRGPKVTKILAVLALRAGHLVETEVLVDELWGENPPARAIGTVRTHVYHLRRLLAEHLGVPGGELIRTEAPGYVLAVPAQHVDAVRFAELAGQARRLLAEGAAGEAFSVARSGLELWRGTALANVPAGRLLTGHVRRLDELYTQSQALCVEAGMRLGRHRELIPELRDLVARYPFDEWFHASLMEVLRRSDRRADALLAFRELEATLEIELGVGPSAGVRDLQRSILM